MFPKVLILVALNVIKRLGALFICLVTRAIHTELVTSIDAVDFRNSFRRFLSVRGVPHTIYSDNGTNFVVVKRQMDDQSSFETLETEAKLKGIKWVMNPPLASHFGGSWERAIGSIRKILDVCLLQLGQRILTGYELHTLLMECSNINNNTPLYDACTTEEYPQLITPQNLLSLKDDPNPPELETFSAADLNAYGRRRWRRVQHLSDEFFRRWRTFYLNTLQKRSKWQKNRPNLVPGDLVVLRDKVSC